MAALVVDATPYAVARSYTSLLNTTPHHMAAATQLFSESQQRVAARTRDVQLAHVAVSL